MRVLAFMGVVVLAFGCGRANPLVDDDIASRGASLTKGTAGATNGDSDYCNDPNNLCADAEGDCDHNDQCQSGLICIPNQGADFGLARSVDLCLPAHCADRIQNGGESNVDCGTDVGCKVCGTVKLVYGQAGAVNGTTGYCSSSSPCPAGSGDCNHDTDCQAGLICVPNVGLKYGFSTRIDVCAPSHCTNRITDGDELGADCGGSCAPCTTPIVLTTNIPLGAHGYCTASHTCGALLGDCDHDTDCNAGLVCVANTGGLVGLPSNADVCMLATCHNRMLDMGETLADCGGPCPACAGAKGNVRATNGNPAYCSNPANLCTAGQGNCTSDAQCAAGLVCINERGASFSLPAGVNVCLLATCNDAALDGDETGIDCGGSCGACVSIRGLNGGASCANGMMDGNETAVDCGGSCPSCGGPTCSDGLQNGTETGVDCGGTCLACGSCTDSIMNGTETGVDCGGTCPNACPTCTDGIQNGGEVGVDCGGVCAPCVCTPSSTQSCYTGPSGTLNVGLCVAGSQTCASDGASWGACGGEVDPAAEDCTMGVDANCDGIIATCAVTHVQSAGMIGGLSDQLVRAVATDPATGNVYAVGYFLNQIQFPGETSPHALAVGAHDIFVAKFDATGALQTAQVFGDKYDQFALTAAWDAFNNRVLIGGYFTGSMALPDGTILTAPTAGNQQDGFVIALDSDLKHELGSSFSFGDAVKNQQAWSIDVNQANGEAYVAGYYRGSITLASITTMTAADWHAFIAKFDSSGPIWVNGWGSSTATGQTYLRSIAYEPVHGAIAAGGYFNGTTSFTGVDMSSTGLADNDGYLVLIDPATGIADLQFQAGGSGDQQIRRVAARGNGSLAVAGYFTQGIQIGSLAPITADVASAYDSFVFTSKTNLSSNWIRQISGNDGQYIDALEYSAADGTLRVGGEFDTELKVGSESYTSAGGRDGYFAEFNPDGSYKGGISFGDANAQHVYGVNRGIQSSTWVAGAGAGSFPIGQFALVSSGGQDGILVHANFGDDARADLDGTGGELPSGGYWSSLSADGTWVAFITSDAIDSVNDLNGDADVYIRNRTTGAVVLASIANDGSQITSGKLVGTHMSDDGNLVGFATDASLDPADTNGSWDFYVYNRTGHSLQLASCDASGVALPHGIVVTKRVTGALSADGSTVAFATVDSLDPRADASGSIDNIYTRKLSGGAVTLVTTVAGRGFVAADADDPMHGIALNADGSVVAFVMANDQKDLWNFKDDGAYTIDLATGKLERLDLDWNGLAVDGSEVSLGGISADGRFVAFTSNAGLDSGDTNSDRDMYIRDRAAQRTTWISVPIGGHAGGSVDWFPFDRKQAISANGRFVVFSASNDDFDAHDTNGFQDVFVRDVWLGTTTLASATTTAASGNATSTWPAISSDGTAIAFQSDATNLTTSDTNGTTDVFVGVPNSAASLPAVYAVASAPSIVEHGGQGKAFVQLQIAPTANVSVPITLDDPTVATLSASSVTFTPMNWATTKVVTATVNDDDAPNGDRGFKFITGTSTSADSNYAGLPSGGLNGILAFDSLDMFAVTKRPYRADSKSVNEPFRVSLDGHYEIFVSADDFLVPGDTNGASDAFVRDRVTGDITRINVSSNGVEGATGVPTGSSIGEVAISADGHFAVFVSSDTNLVPGDTASTPKVFLRDLWAGTTTRISEPASHVDPDNDSGFPIISADGTTVVFSSEATNLVPGDTNGVFDIFTYDIGSGTIARVLSPGHVEPDNVSVAIDLSSDGTKILMASPATTWSNIDPGGIFQVFLVNTALGTSIMVSQLAGVAANDPLGDGVLGFGISPGGNYVVFSTDADNLDPSDTNGIPDVYLYDVGAKTLTRVTTATTGTNGSTLCNVSEDTVRVTFQSDDTDMPDSSGLGVNDVFEWVQTTGVITRVSRDAKGGDLPSGVKGFAMAPEGNFIAFASDDDVLTDGTGSSIFVEGFAVPTEVSVSVSSFHVSNSGTTTITAQLSSAPSANVTVTLASSDPTLGTVSPVTLTFTPANWDVPQTITITGAATGNGTFDVTLTSASADPAYNTSVTTVSGQLGSSNRVSTDSSDGELPAGGAYPAISAHGNFVAFATKSDVAFNDTNRSWDIYLKDRSSGALTLCSIGNAGEQVPAANGGVQDAPRISDDGRYVGFETKLPLESDDTNSATDFYVFDSHTLTLELASRDESGNALTAGIRPRTGAISRDGSTFAFMTQQTIDPLAIPSMIEVYTRKRATGVVTLVSQVAHRGFDAAAPRGIVMSADGTIVGFSFVDPADLWGYSKGIFVVNTATGDIARADLDVKGNGVDPGAMPIVGGMSADGRYIAFYTADALDPADGNADWDVYIRDLGTSRTIWASQPLPSLTGGVRQNQAFSQGLSANGRFAVFESAADDFDPVDTNGMNDVFVYDLWQRTTTLASQTPYNVNGDASSSMPAISADGASIAFMSYADNFVVSDLNTNGDVFVGTTNAAANTAQVMAIASTLPIVEFGGAAQLYVQLQTQPTANVTIPIATDDATVATVSTSSLTFTHANWATPQIVTATAVDDDAANGDRGFKFVIGAPISTDANYAALTMYGSDGVTVSDSQDVTIDSIRPYRQESKAPDAARQTLSSNGRYDIFAAVDGLLVPGDTNGKYDAFVRDRVTGKITRVDVASDGSEAMAGVDNKQANGISDDGRYAVFSSTDTSLVVGDAASGLLKIFLRDTVAGTTKRLSEGTAHADPDDESFHPIISADGSTVVFCSAADNLVAGDTNGAIDMFVYKTATGTLTRILSPASVEPDGDSFALGLSADGTKVVFYSTATTWSAVVTANPEVFYADLTAGTSRMVSISNSGVPSDNSTTWTPRDVSWASISPDGSFIAFATVADNLDATDTNGRWDVYLYDVHGVYNSGTPFVFWMAPGAGSTDAQMLPVVTNGASEVFFVSDQSDLVGGDMNGALDAFIWNLSGATTMRVSLDYHGNELPSGIESGRATMSADGNFVSFVSTDDVTSTGIAPALFTVGYYVAPAILFSKTRVVVSEPTEWGNSTTATVRLSTVPSGTVTITLTTSDPSIGTVSPTTITFTPANWDIPQTITITGSNDPTISLWMFTISASGASSDSSYNGSGASISGWLVDNARVSTDPGGGELLSGGSYTSAISNDGRYVTFMTADAIDARDLNGNTDYYVKDLLSGATTLVSIGNSGEQWGAGRGSFLRNATISDDGALVGFVTDAQLDPSDTNPGADFYLFHVLANTLSLASLDESGMALPNGLGNAAVEYATALSPNGKMVAYGTSDPIDPLVSGGNFEIYSHNLVTGAVTLVTQIAGHAFDPPQSHGMIFSADGSVLAYQFSDKDNLWGFGAWGTYVVDLNVGPSSIERVDLDTLGVASMNSFPCGMSADGRFVAFYTNARLDAADSNGVWDMYVRDRIAGITTWASRPLGGHAGSVDADGRANQSMSANGRFIVFSGPGDDFDAADTNGYEDVFVYDMWTDTTRLASSTFTNAAGDERSFEPAISADGQWIAFTSKADNFVGNDMNGAADVFVGQQNVAAVTPAMNAVATARPMPELGGIGEVLVQVQTKPASDVTVAVVPTTGVATATPATLTFTPVNWAQTQVSTLHAIDRGPGAGDIGNHNILTSTSADSNYNGLSFNIGETALDSLDMTNDSLAPYRAASASFMAQDQMPRLSLDGRYELFVHKDSTLVAGDTNTVEDLFEKDRVLGTIQRINVSSTNTESATGLGSGSIGFAFDVSADGRYVVFLSQAEDLGDGDTLGKQRVFLRDTLLQTTVRVSQAPGGGDPDGDAIGVAISADGSTVAFSSRATNLVAADANGKYDIFIYKVGSRALTRVLAPLGHEPSSDAFMPTLSADGTKLSFVAWDTWSGGTSCSSLFAYWVDLSGSEYGYLSDTTSNLVVLPASISPDGNFIAALSNSTTLSFKRLLSAPSYTCAMAAGLPFNLYLADAAGAAVTAATASMVGVDKDSGNSLPVVSTDGEYIAFMTSDSTLVTGDTNGKPDVFVWQNGANTISRLSLDISSNELPSGVDAFGFSGNGRYVSFNTPDDASAMGTSGGLFTVGYMPRPGVSEHPAVSKNLLVDENASWSDHTKSITLALETKPTADVTLTVASSDTTRVTVSPSSITFHAASWNTPQLITVTGVDNANATGDLPFQITFGTTTSADANYNGLTVTNYNGYLVDDDDLALASLISLEALGYAGTGNLASTGYSSAPAFLQAMSGDGSEVFFRSGEAGFNRVYGNGTGNDLYVRNRATETTTALNIPDDPSLGLVTSADSTLLVFATPIALLPGDTNGVHDIYAYSTLTGALERISVTTAGAQGANKSLNPAVSADGRYVVFQSNSNTLAPHGSNPGSTIYLRDRVAHTTERISMSSTGVDAVADCVWPSVSDDGRYVGFSAIGSAGLTTPPAPAVAQIVRDRVTHAMRVVNLAPGGGGSPCDGTKCSGTISGNGRYVLWTSDKPQLHDVRYAAAPAPQVALTDLWTNTTQIVSASPTGVLPNSKAIAAFVQGGISTDGRVVAFVSDSTNLVPRGTPKGFAQVYVLDRWTNTMKVESLTDTGVLSSGVIKQIRLSRDGHFVSFETNDATWPPTPAIGSGMRVFDRSTELATMTPGLFVDGPYLSYTSEDALKSGFSVVLKTAPSGTVTVPIASNDLTEGTVSRSSLTFTTANWNVPQVVVMTGVDDSIADGDVPYHVQIGRTSSSDSNYNNLVADLDFVNADNDGIVLATPGRPDGVLQPSIDGDGNLVAYVSSLDNQIYVRDILGATDWLVSYFPGSGMPGDGVSRGPSISANGNLIAFESDATNLVAGDTNGFRDIFLYNNSARTMTLVSESTGGPSDSSSGNAEISPDGRYVLFQSDADNLVAGDTNSAPDAFLYDSRGGTLELVSRTDSGALGCGVGIARMSDDARYIAFASKDLSCAWDTLSSDLYTRALWASNNSGLTGVFLRDRTAASTKYVSFTRSGNALDDAPLSIGSVDISGDGHFLAFSAGTGDAANSTGLFVRDLAMSTTRFVTPIVHAKFGGARLGATGANIVFTASSTELDPQNTTPYTDIYAFDQRTEQTTRLTNRYDLDLPADGQSTAPAVSHDGRAVAFVSTSKTIAPGADGSTQLYVMKPGSFPARPGIWVSAGEDIRAYEDGSVAGFFTIVLTSAPGADVTVNIASNNTSELTLPITSFTFTTANWNTPQIVEVDGVDDHVCDGDQDVTLSFSDTASLDPHFAGLLTPDISVISTDVETAANVSVTSAGAAGTLASSVLGHFVTGPADVSNFFTVTGALTMQHVLSSDGRYVAFYSDADNLVAGDTSGTPNYFLHDTVGGSTVCIDSNMSGVPTHEGSGWVIPSVSGDGRYVAFSSDASDLVAGDTNGVTDVFLFDRTLNSIERVSLDSSSAEIASGGSIGGSVSDDGRYVAFFSLSDAVTPHDSNGLVDVFVRDRWAGTTTLISVGMTGNASGTAPATGSATGAGAAMISGDGSTIVYVSVANDIVAGDTNGKLDVFAANVFGTSQRRISTDRNGNELSGDSFSPFVSRSGRFIAFVSQSDVMLYSASPIYGVFLYDAVTNTMEYPFTDGAAAGTYAASGPDAPGAQFAPSVSDDGHYVAMTVYGASSVLTSYVADVWFHGAAIASSSDPLNPITGIVPDPYSAVISANGRRVVYTTDNDDGSAPVNDSNGQDDVYVSDVHVY